MPSEAELDSLGERLLELAKQIQKKGGPLGPTAPESVQLNAMLKEVDGALRLSVKEMEAELENIAAKGKERFAAQEQKLAAIKKTSQEAAIAALPKPEPPFVDGSHFLDADRIQTAVTDLTAGLFPKVKPAIESKEIWES